MSLADVIIVLVPDVIHKYHYACARRRYFCGKVHTFLATQTHNKTHSVDIPARRRRQKSRVWRFNLVNGTAHKVSILKLPELLLCTAICIGNCNAMQRFEKQKLLFATASGESFVYFKAHIVISKSHLFIDVGIAFSIDYNCEHTNKTIFRKVFMVHWHWYLLQLSYISLIETHHRIKDIRLVG